MTPAPEPTKGSIAGTTFFDDNADGNADADDAPVSQTNVALFLNGTRIEQTSTDRSGNYFFGNLDVDACYTVGFASGDPTLQLGTAVGDAVALTDGVTGDICLTEAAPDVIDVDAAFIPVPPAIPPADNVICGVAWLDANSNGVFDGTDSTLDNVKVRLLGDDNLQIGMIATGNNGAYAFESLAEGSYQVVFATPDGHEPTTGVGQPTAGSSFINSNGQTSVFSLPGDGNTSASSACTIQHVNAGYVELPIVIPPTTANNDRIEFVAGESVAVDFLSNDEICDGTVDQVDILGHNVPGLVVFETQQQRIAISMVDEPGTYEIEYGVRGGCGSYGTASIRVVVTAPPVIVSSMAPDAPLCRAEVGGADNGGVDVFHPDELGFASEYIFFNRDREPLVTLAHDPAVYAHFLFIEDTDRNRGSRIRGNYINLWETEWNGLANNYDQTAVFYVAAVENGVQSALSLCARDDFSPIALDLDGHGKIKRVSGEFSVDLNNDGIDELLTEWFAPSAGILVRANSSGKVTGEHLFGNLPGLYEDGFAQLATLDHDCLLYTSPSPRDQRGSRMPSSA